MATPDEIQPGVVSVAKFPFGNIPFRNSVGEAGVLAGKQYSVATNVNLNSSWVNRQHPARYLWVEDERKQRASYLADQRHLAPFIVPHRFEGDFSKNPEKLGRAKLGYGVGLNKAYLQEIFGHIRGTPAHYWWGVIGAESDQDIAIPPKGEPALKFWNDATSNGVTWTNFFEGKVLEWITTSVGGFILVDSNRPEGLVLTQALADQLGFRASVKFIPMSWVEDFGRSDSGYRWIKIREIQDQRVPNPGESGDEGYRPRHVLYELQFDGRTQITRYDDDGNQVGPTIFQKVVDTHGRGCLPLLEAKLFDHPDLDFLGAGLLMGLDDIVIDLYNLLTEIREAYRDAAFSFLAYRGPNSEEARQQVSAGSRWVDMGDDPTATLERKAAEASEVTAGIDLFNIGLKNWSLGAKRRSLEIMEASSARSGVSLKAEFQLDLRPLLVAVTEVLDSVETNVMFVLAQVLGFSPQDANECKVVRETQFQLEQEATRIARITGEFLGAIPAMPAALLERMIDRWAASIDFLDLDEKIDGKSLRDIISAQAKEIADAEAKARVARSQFMASAAANGTLGGGKGAGGGLPGDQPPKPASPTRDPSVA